MRPGAGVADLIKFLGTAGARFVVAKQLRSSAGTFIRMKGVNILFDPGPGTLVRLARSKPAIDVTELDAVILSHFHIDHSNDVNAIIDAMTAGGLERKGMLFAPADCLSGTNAVVLNYLRDYLDAIVTLEAEHDYSIGGVSFSTSIRHEHGSETYGIMFSRGGRKISFLVDTRFVPQLLDSYAGSDILIINVVRHKAHERVELQHLCLDDAREILAGVRPSLAVLTHFGMTMIRAKPWLVAQKLSRELGIEVIAATDGKTLTLD